MGPCHRFVWGCQGVAISPGKLATNRQAVRFGFAGEQSVDEADESVDEAGESVDEAGESDDKSVGNCRCNDFHQLRGPLGVGCPDTTRPPPKRRSTSTVGAEEYIHHRSE